MLMLSVNIVKFCRQQIEEKKNEEKTHNFLWKFKNNVLQNIVKILTFFWQTMPNRKKNENIL